MRFNRLGREAFSTAARRPRVVGLLFAFAHVGIFAGLFRGAYSIPYSGTGLYYEYAGKTLAGLLPYRDFVLEYPPAALLFFTLPRVLGESFRWYYVWFQVEVVLFDLVTVAALAVAAVRWRLPIFRVLAAYTIAILAVGPIALQQYDIFPATFTLLAVVAFAGRRLSLAAGLIAVGVMTKVYPLLLVPLFVLVEWRRGAIRDLWRPAAVFMATCVVACLPWLLIAPASFGVLLSYHTKRGIHLDSAYGTIALVAHSLLGAAANVVFAFASWNLDGPLPIALARASTFVLLFVLGLVYLRFDRCARNDPERAATDITLLGHGSALVIIAALPASKVLSPQYLIWATTLLPLVATPRRRVIWSLFAATGVMTYFMYPFYYDSLLARDDWAIAVMGIRNALLVSLALVLARSLPSPARDAHPNSPNSRTS